MLLRDWVEDSVIRAAVEIGLPLLMTSCLEEHLAATSSISSPSVLFAEGAVDPLDRWGENTSGAPENIGSSGFATDLLVTGTV